MEEILASIKRIIAEDGEAAVHAAEKRRPARGRALGKPPIEALNDDSVDEPVAERPVVERSVTEPPIAQPEPFGRSPAPETAPEVPPAAHREEVLELTEKFDSLEEEQATVKPAPLVSDETATASRSALSALSALIVKPAPLADNTLEGLVREMLRPMLKEWLDANLPELVEAMVAKEISRITGKTF